MIARAGHTAFPLNDEYERNLNLRVRVQLTCSKDVDLLRLLYQVLSLIVKFWSPPDSTTDTLNLLGQPSEQFMQLAIPQEWIDRFGTFD